MREWTMARKQVAPTLPLGARVRFTQELVRQEVDMGEEAGCARWLKVWLPEPRTGEGVLVGYRTLRVGYVSEETEEEFGHVYSRWNEWNNTGTVHAALVSVDLYQKPIYVPRKDVQEVPNA